MDDTLQEELALLMEKCRKAEEEKEQAVKALQEDRQKGKSARITTITSKKPGTKVRRAAEPAKSARWVEHCKQRGRTPTT